jgi:hypothetical protein
MDKLVAFLAPRCPFNAAHHQLKIIDLFVLFVV